jgi:hypothetical protein
MLKGNKDENKHKKRISYPSERTDSQYGLSDVWRELLGERWHEAVSPALPGDISIPTLDVDPWRALLQEKGIEIVDIEKMQLHISEQEVDEILQKMQDSTDNQGKK